MRRTTGFALAVGLFALWPTTSAHAQAAYGYDSYHYNLPSSASYWYNAGYGGAYTDPSTNTFANNELAPFRAVAPYGQPPYGSLSAGNGLPRVSTGAVTSAPVRQPKAAPKRPLRRLFRRR